MKPLILVKHSLSLLKPGTPPHKWQLSEEGRDRCLPLAAKLSQYSPEVIVSSMELKAKETAQLVADQLGLSTEVLPDLHEHDRRNEAFYDLDTFESKVKSFFAHPAQLVFGEETAHQAQERFFNAISEVQQKFPNQTTVVVAHGTVISLYVSQLEGIDPHPFWQKLDMPAIVVIQENSLSEVIESI